MNDQELLALNAEGFIPGPGETEEAFLARNRRAKEFFGASVEKWIPKVHWHWVELQLKEIFDFQPAYLPAFYSNKSLAPWQGAACWIEGKSVSAIQLRCGLKKGSYLGFYGREEILAHEAVHAARCAFEESSNEEFFAYMTSDKKWRRVLGPLIQKPWEIWPFFLLNICAVLSRFSSLYVEGADEVSSCFFWLASCWGGVGFWRLVRQHLRLRRAGSCILRRVKNSGIARAVLFRLTDEEIWRFARGELFESYAEKQSCLRWRLIRLAYLKDN